MKNIPIRKLGSRDEPVTVETFDIRALETILGGKELFQERHRHDFFFVVVLKKGSGDHEIDFSPYKVKDHTVFFLRPGQVHQLRLKAKSTGYLIRFKHDFLHLSDKDSNQTLLKASKINHYKLDAEQFGKIIPVLDHVFNEFTTRQGEYQEVILSYMKIFFIELNRQRVNDSAPSSREKRYQQERLEKFLNLIETNHIAHKQVQYYADKLNLSAYQLNAITKATLGKTSSAVIDDYILLEAKRYLFATPNQVSHIADLLGFEDVSYFIRFFKRNTGYSPEKFRNNFK